MIHHVNERPVSTTVQSATNGFYISEAGRIQLSLLWRNITAIEVPSGGRSCPGNSHNQIPLHAHRTGFELEDVVAASIVADVAFEVFLSVWPAHDNRKVASG